jgi:hypothetical protein
MAAVILILSAGLYSSDSRNDPLERPPEPEHLKRLVEPSSGDTVAGAVAVRVMQLVVLDRQNQPQGLQGAGSQASVQVVRGFVDLVGEHHVEVEEKQADLDLELAGHGGVRGQPESHVGHAHQAPCEVVPVGFDEVVPGHLLRIDVVLPEGAQQVLPHHWGVQSAPGIAEPVHEPAQEVGHERCQESVGQ